VRYGLPIHAPRGRGCAAYCAPSLQRQRLYFDGLPRGPERLEACLADTPRPPKSPLEQLARIEFGLEPPDHQAALARYASGFVRIDVDCTQPLTDAFLNFLGGKPPSRFTRIAAMFANRLASNLLEVPRTSMRKRGSVGTCEVPRTVDREHLRVGRVRPYTPRVMFRSPESPGTTPVR